MRARSALVLACVSTLAASLTVLACADDDDGVIPPKDSGLDSFTPFDALAPEAGGNDGGADAEAGIRTTTFVSFDPDPKKSELPEAISFGDASAYVSLVALGQIAKIAYPAGKRSLYAELPVQPGNLTLGSAFDVDDNLYVGVAAPDTNDALAVAAAGIYKITLESDGGTTVALWASGVTLTFPNGLSFDPDGNLYVTDPVEGAIYKLGAAGAVGTATPWITDATLQGDMAACPGKVQAFPFGANGIFAEKDAVWAVNTDKGTLVKVVVDVAGAAGAATAVANDCANLEGVDGMRPDPRSPTTRFLATNKEKNSILSITRTGQVAVVAAGQPPFYNPADLAHVTGTSNPTVMIVVNASFAEGFAPADAGLMLKPSLVTLSLP